MNKHANEQKTKFDRYCENGVSEQTSLEQCAFYGKIVKDWSSTQSNLTQMELARISKVLPKKYVEAGFEIDSNNHKKFAENLQAFVRCAFDNTGFDWKQFNLLDLDELKFARAVSKLNKPNDVNHHQLRDNICSIVIERKVAAFKADSVEALLYNSLLTSYNDMKDNIGPMYPGLRGKIADALSEFLTDQGQKSGGIQLEKITAELYTKPKRVLQVVGGLLVVAALTAAIVTALTLFAPLSLLPAVVGTIGTVLASHIAATASVAAVGGIAGLICVFAGMGRGFSQDLQEKCEALLAHQPASAGK